MKRLAFVVLLLCLHTSLSVPTLRGEEKQEPARPDELKPLELLVGEWKVGGVNKAAEWNPKESKLTGTDSIHWALKERFLTNRNVDETNKVEGLSVIGYHPVKKCFTTHYFNSQGVIGDWQGTFDAKTKTFTWTTVDGDMVGRMEQRCSENAIEGFVLFKDKAGKVYLDMTFKNTRKK